MILKGRSINGGQAEGKAIVWKNAFSFLGEVDPQTGDFVEGHELSGNSIAGRILVFPTGRGSTAGPIIAWRLMKVGKGPKAMICQEAEPVIALDAITAGVPMVDRFNEDPLEVMKTGDWVKVNATDGVIEIKRPEGLRRHQAEKRKGHAK